MTIKIKIRKPTFSPTLSILTVAALFASTVPLWAEPTLRQCNSLKQELESLQTQGVVEDLEKGPEWVKSNLPANRVTRVLKYLNLHEQVRFRCENIFAEAEAQEAINAAANEARIKALANIPPPPERRPPPPPAHTQTSTKAGSARIPPLPERQVR